MRMSKKIMLLVIAAVSAIAFTALPAVASATTPEVDFAGGDGTPTFTGTFASGSLTTASETVKCGPENHVSGEWTSKTTGTISIVFTHCKGPLEANCQNTATTGEIKTGPYVFHLEYIKGFTKTPGILVTPPAGGQFAEFKCSLITIKVTGNGVLGHVENTCGEVSAEQKTSFTSSSAGVQTYQEWEGSTEKWHLKSKTGGGSEVEASEDATASTTLEEGVKGTLTCP